MILRQRQAQFVERCIDALRAHGAALGVAPTGAGKTVMLSAVASRYATALVLQHRDELVAQNEATMRAMSPRADVGRWTAEEKRRAAITYAMVPTLSRDASLSRMWPVDLLVVDEAHHTSAPSYARIVERARELNPRVHLLGVTATPERGDGRGLRAWYPVCADQISIGELLESGHLVRPVAHVIDVGASEGLAGLRRTRGGEYDLDDAAELLGTSPVLDSVYDHWSRLARERQTIIFAATCDHARAIAAHWRARGIATGIVTGEDDDADRDRTLAAVARGDTRVLVNVAVATEGYDCPPISCVVLMRPSSYRSTMVQMIGRGLRVIDPERYPHAAAKADCVVLDFGRSILLHGGIEQVIDLDGRRSGEAPRKRCVACGGEIPLHVRECPLCGHVPEVTEREARGETDVIEIRDIAMRMVDILAESPFRWHAVEPRIRVAVAITASAVVHEHRGRWYATGIVRPEGEKRRIVRLACGDEAVATQAASEFLRAHGDLTHARKSRAWMGQPPTDRQREILGLRATDLSMTRYEASCAIELRFSRSALRALYARSGGPAPSTPQMPSHLSAT